MRQKHAISEMCYSQSVFILLNCTYYISSIQLIMRSQNGGLYDTTSSILICVFSFSNVCSFLLLFFLFIKNDLVNLSCFKTLQILIKKIILLFEDFHDI